MRKIHLNHLKNVKSKNINNLQLEATDNKNIFIVKEDLYSEIKSEIFSTVEIHTLICKKDLTLGINNFKSLLIFDEFKSMKIYFHNDGSLQEDDIKLLKEFPNTVVINRSLADSKIVEFINNYHYSKMYRLVEKHIHLWHKIKLFDYFYFSESKKILGLDSDLLFMKEPTSLIELILLDQGFYFPDTMSAYCFNEPKNEVPVPDNVNTGLIYIPSEQHYDINYIEKALSNLLRDGVNYFPSWIEQSAFAHMFYEKNNFISLPKEKYRIPFFQAVDIKTVECLHFVSYPATRELYSQYKDYLSINKNTDIFYKKDFIVNFKEKSISLSLSIRKSENILFFEYFWDLKNANIDALDHQFLIEEDDKKELFKFQSERNGFFIYSPKSKNINIKHTTDWYGEVDWQIIDSIEVN